METGKTGKYLKYAIGEIALVMIGILLALQVNNWNENRKAYNNSLNYLTEIVSDLQKDTIHFNHGINSLNSLIADEEWVLNKSDYSHKDVDRLWDCLSGWYMDYKMNTRTFEKIQNEGNSELVGFEELSEKINTYYTTVNSRAKTFTGWDIKDVTERQIWLRDLELTIETSNYRMQAFGAGQVTKSFPMRQDSIVNAELIIAFANSTRGRNHYKNNYIRHKRIIDVFKDVVSESTSLAKEIEKELKK
jgi:RNAse (barnase) inhibitor barstar